MSATQMSDKPLRVLHVLGGLDRGGIETFLMHVLKRRDAARLSMDFVRNLDEVGAYETQILASGSHIFCCAFTTQPHKYSTNFVAFSEKTGRSMLYIRTSIISMATF